MLLSAKWYKCNFRVIKGFNYVSGNMTPGHVLVSSFENGGKYIERDFNLRFSVTCICVEHFTIRNFVT